MIDATPLACTLWEDDGTFIDCNNEVLRIFGLASKADFLTEPGAFDPEFQPDGSPSGEKFASMKKLVVKTGRHSFTWMHKTTEGDELPVETTLVKVPWLNSYRLAVYDRDLRDIIAAEKKSQKASERSRELEIQTRSAQVASEAKSRFLASMSHEIRTPMNAILGLSDLMRIDNFDETQRSYFENIRKISKQLLQLINDILDFSKIEAGKMELVPVHFDLLEMFDHISSMSRFMAEAKKLEFRYSFDPDTPHVVYGDDIRMRQTVLNIINNAIKYTRTGYVDFSVKKVSDDGRAYLAFVVKDSGIGIRKKDLNNLFVAFQQFDSKLNRDVAGTGLGLSISSMLVNMMGGRIEVESKYGKGSVFTVLIPLKEGDPTLIERATLKELHIAVDGTKALVVDDNPINIKVAAAYLSRHNIQSDASLSGVEALKMVKKVRYDLIFMDHMMPEMDGVETVKRLQKIFAAGHRKVPIIALTANAISGVKGMLIEAGMDDYMSKPVDPFHLNKIISKWLPQEKLAGVKVEKVIGVSEPTDEGCVLDSKAGLKNSADNKELYEQLITNFIELHSADVRYIEEALKDGDVKTAYRLAHTLKSNAALLGAERMRRVAFEMESDFRNGNTDRACSSLAELEVEMAASLEEMYKIVPPKKMAGRVEKRSLVKKIYSAEGERVNIKSQIRDKKNSAVVSASRQSTADTKEGDDDERNRKQRNGQGKPFDYEKALSFIAKLKPLLESGNTECLEMKEDIRSYLGALGEECDELVAQIWDFEFERALRTLATLERMLI
jgi:signal transduction histidine kinase/DNA-binding response OmpR family regulator